MPSLDLEVVAVHTEAAGIRSLTLVAPDRSPLPGFEAGAHITLSVPGVGLRKYSLISSCPVIDVTATPQHYRVGVRLDSAGGGGSRWMFSLKSGDHITSAPPQNNFPLKPGSVPVLLLAGGIGVTPLISMAASLTAHGRPFRFIYASRSDADFAFRSELEALAGSRLQFHADNSVGRLLDITSHLSQLEPDSMVYTCGPRPMLKATLDAVKTLGWSRDRVSFELFYSVSA